MGRRLLLAAGLSLVAAACSGSGEAPTTVSVTDPAVTTTQPAASTTTTTTSTTVAEATTTTAAPPTTTSTIDEPTTTTTAAGDVLPDEIERIDYLTFGQGALPAGFSIEGPGTGLTASAVLQAIDGLAVPRGFVSAAAADTAIEMTFELPASTTFDRFAIPEITEVPSSSVTFFATVEVLGSDDGVDFTTLASADLETHTTRDQVTELELVASLPVRFVTVRLSGGINVLEAETSLEFSEIIGNGTQDAVALVDGFTGIWDAKLPDIDRSIGFIELRQDGAVVTGCFGEIDLTGTVTGNLVRMNGIGRRDGTPSAYIFGLTADGALQGVISSNGGPFGFTPTVVAPEGTTTDCSNVAVANPLGCGSIVHGINFDFNSARLRPESEPVLQQLFAGLLADDAAAIVVEGHTSTEGTDAYNQGLSERRAQSVVDDLVRRGISPDRISAVGKGETEPLIAPDPDEAARSINRRVEIECG